MNSIYTMIQKLRNLSGNAQLEFLKECPELKDILEWCYNPFKKYFTKDVVWIDNLAGVHICEENGELKTVIKALLESLSDRTLSGNAAKDAIASHMSQIQAKHGELLAGIINKDLGLNLGVKSINKVFLGLIPETEDGGEKIPVMLLKTFDPKKAKYPLLAAPKLDGVRGIVKNGKMWSRSGKEIKGMDHIVDYLTEKYPMTDFDGEIMIPGKGFDSTSGLIRNTEPVPNAIYNIFDTQNKYQTMAERTADLSCLHECNFVKIIEKVLVEGELELTKLHNNLLEQGYEGTVVYDPKSMYEDKRSYDWMRIVPIKSEDCKVIGFEEGKGRLAGTLGKIIVDFKGKSCKVGTGFSDLQRNDIWFNQEKYINVIAECEYKELSKNGIMRQPRFKGFRYDKE